LQGSDKRKQRKKFDVVLLSCKALTSGDGESVVSHIARLVGPTQTA